MDTELKIKLENWIRDYYGGGSECKELLQKMLVGIANEDGTVLLKVMEIMEYKLNYLRGKFPKEWSVLNELYMVLVDYLSVITK